MMRVGIVLLGLTLAGIATAEDRLIILSPHRKSIQDEYIPVFKDHYKKNYGTDVRVDWLDQGGTSDDVRFLRSKFNRKTKTAGIDVFWGGGTATFLELKGDGLLAPYKLPKELAEQVPQQVAGIPLWDSSESWYASAMSSFGMFYNKKILEWEKLPAPQTWEDLMAPRMFNDISTTDPRHSGTANTMNSIIMQAYGWERGWQILTAIAGNTRGFAHTSTDPIKAVVSGDVITAMAVDFYALAKIGDLGPENLGFTIPAGQTVLDPDPVGIIQGAPNRKVAERFVNFVLSNEGQKLLVLPKGVPGGPRKASLGRLAVNRKTYDETKGQRVNEINPFEQKAFLMMDWDRAARMKRIFNDLYGAILVDTHGELKKVWGAMVRKKALTPEWVAKISTPPVTEKEFWALAVKWDDDVLRNQTINAWVKYAKHKYETSAH